MKETGVPSSLIAISPLECNVNEKEEEEKKAEEMGSDEMDKDEQSEEDACTEYLLVMRAQAAGKF